MFLDELMHYGTKRHSGRYPWGSGDTPYQHSGDFLARIEELKKQGLSEKEIAKSMKMSTTDLRMQSRVASHERRQLLADRARSLREDGKSLNEIASIMGFANDSSVRSLLNENTAASKNMARTTADILKKEVEKKGMIDIGAGVERELGVSQNTLKEASFILETEGYNVYGIGVPQVTNPKQQTTTTVLTKPEVAYKDVYDNMGDIQSVADYHSIDGGKTFNQLQYPASIDSSRIMINYGDKGGIEKDGVIELRRGVADLDLGNAHYAQVRILTDGTHYLKGMAMYADDLPDGVDIRFNTNKNSSVAKMDVLKKIKHDDPNNPFGAYIKADGQSYYETPDGKKKLSAINKLKEEGDWDTMSKNLSSQFLSKQPKTLIDKQLKLTLADSEAELDDICKLTNPTIKKKLLLDYANECDGAVVTLKAAALPRQKTQVLLPVTDLKETEIYAPNFKNGEKVCLIRYPHGGTFEIPELTVNNKNPSGKKILGNAVDAVGINPKVAERLSGADFDGDTAVVIPTNSKVKIKTTPAFDELKTFSPKEQYAEHPGMTYMTKANTQKQMGVVSNLITDMTLKGATDDEIVRAVKHSMVVIDAEKHKLDYKQSEKDNGIAELKKKYQGYVNDDGNEVGGASTLISRKKQDILVPERRGSGRIDKDTGEVTYKETGRVYEERKKVKDPLTGEITYVNTGRKVKATTAVKLMNYTKDIHTLSSGTPEEEAYADYANNMKKLANKARKEYMNTGRIAYSASAKATYEKEVAHLNAQLDLALTNAPRERSAQVIANSKIKAMQQDNPQLDKKDLKKARQIAIYEARSSVGASGKETRITISDREWEAIQAGAITDTKLSQILRYADADAVRQRATPRTMNTLSSAKISKIKAMAASGHTNAEIAAACGCSTSSVSKCING
jgi:DNA-binding NarL/FixJ family response regulator